MTARVSFGQAEAPASLASERLVQFEWIRRNILSTHEDKASLIGSLIDAVHSSTVAGAVLGDPVTEHWVSTAVLLIDREAPQRLPEGQLAAHLAMATNLVAGLTWTAVPLVQVRFNHLGEAPVPVVGTLVGPSSRAGLEMEFNPRHLPVEIRLEPPASSISTLPPLGSVHGGQEAASRTDHSSTRARKPNWLEGGSMIDRWKEAGGQMAQGQVVALGRSTSSELRAMLNAIGLPEEIPRNDLTEAVLRADHSFDHLSLMSILDHARFEQIAAVAGRDGSRTGVRITAHTKYISRLPGEAASLYATLLVDDPGDVDLWRDTCWAVRHMGKEDFSHRWILHADEMVGAALTFAWTTGDVSPLGLQATSKPLERICALIDWVTA